ncbi:hypothetical protein QQ054_33280 [Oscillatoria amoena NRMC-F 0135]|nr:hypothetical protein [Oscillatoria amoena NRMC-F 0135]
MKKGQAYQRTISLLVGLGIALAIGVSQLFFFELNNKEASPVDAGQTDEVAFISMPSVAAPSSPAVVETTSGFSFILEILFESAQQQAEVIPVNTLFDNLLQILFRVVISPNAP